MFLLVVSAVVAQTTYPMRNVPMEIQSLFYGYDGCLSVDPSYVTNQGVVLNETEINVRQCTTASVPNPDPAGGPAVLLMRGMNRDVMAAICSPGNPAAWTYEDLDVAPLSFPYPLLTGNDDVQNFLVTMSDGSTANPVCVQAFPADEDNEMKTFVVIGEEWGDGKGFTKNPVKIEIVGDVFFNVNGKTVNGLGLTFTENDDPFGYMKYNSTIRLNEAKMVEFHARGDGAQNDCHTAGLTNTTNVIKLRFTGGGTLNGLFPLAIHQKSAFILRDAFGNSLDQGYLGIAGLGNDLDNNFDLCLDDTFDLNALEDVFVSCSGNVALVPPKGPGFECAAHSMKVDKSRASQDYIDACKCDFDHFYDAVCDPYGSLPASHPLYGRMYCKVWNDTSTCPDIFVDENGDSMSYQACSYRRPIWADEPKECYGLIEDVRATTVEICRANCEEDDACEVYQFSANGECSRGSSENCFGTQPVVGGRKVDVMYQYPTPESPLVNLGEEFTCSKNTCTVEFNANGSAFAVDILMTDFDDPSKYVEIIVDGTVVNHKCDPQQGNSEEWYSCDAFFLMEGAHVLTIIASPDVQDTGLGYVISARIQASLFVPYQNKRRCNGASLGTVDGVGPAECAAVCASTDACAFFTLWGGGGCHLCAQFANHGSQGYTYLMASGSASTSNGLVGYWPFSGSAEDESGFDHHGQLSGGVQLVSDRNGEPNKAYDFTQGKIIIEDDLDLQINTWGVSLWVLISSSDPHKNAFFFCRYKNTQEILKIGIHSNKVHVRYNNGPFKPEASQPLLHDTWHHIAVTHNGNKLTLWINGELTDSLGNSEPMQNSWLTVLGADWDGGNNYNQFLSGSLDDVRLYNRQLNRADIHSLYYGLGAVGTPEEFNRRQRLLRL